MSTESGTLALAASAHGAAHRRVAPSLFQYDYLVLRFLHRDVVRALAEAGRPPHADAVALDVGAGGGPYRKLLEDAGYRVRTLDIAAGEGVDIVGTAERTGLPDRSVDLVLCTQVLEHTRAPWLAMREFARLLRPGGKVVLSVPHVWFFHPHPNDYWRMTAEGVAALCEEGGLRMRLSMAQGGSGAAFFQVANFLVYGVLGRLGAPVYALCNVLGLLANTLVRDTRFALNHACLAVAQGDDEAAEPPA